MTHATKNCFSSAGFHALVRTNATEQSHERANAAKPEDIMLNMQGRKNTLEGLEWSRLAPLLSCAVDLLQQIGLFHFTGGWRTDDLLRWRAKRQLHITTEEEALNFPAWHLQED